MMKIILLLLLLLASPVDAVIRYVSTTGVGTGDCLTTGTACTAARAYAVAVAATCDELIFLNGTYTSFPTLTLTKGGVSDACRITLRPETRHLAILRPVANGAPFIIERGYLTIHSLKIEGQKQNAQCMSVSGTQPKAGLILHDNWCFEIGTIGFYFGAGSGSGTISSTTIRYNLVDEIGWQPCTVSPCVAEGLYIGSSTVGHPAVSNLNFYGNTFSGGSSQAIDIKNNTTNINIHHNVFEDWGTAEVGQRSNDQSVGIVASSNTFGTLNDKTGVKVENNIFRDMLGWSHSSSELVFSQRYMEFNQNVIHDLGSLSAITVTGSASFPQDFTGNTWCNTPTNNAGTASHVNFTGNSFNQAQSVCNTEVARITGEIAARPVIANAEVGLIAANKIRVTLTNQSLAAIDGAAMIGNTTLIASVDHAACSVTGMTPSRTFTGHTIIGTNVIDFTLSGDGNSGDVPLFNCPAGAIVNTGRVGAAWISDLASSAAITNRAVTNNIEGAAPTHVFTQTNYQFYSLRTENGLLVKRPHAASVVNTPVSVVKGGAINLAIQIDCTIADCPPIGMMRKYSKNGGAYTQMPGEFGADGVALFGNLLTASDIPTEGTTVSTCLAGALGAVNGAVVRSPNAVPTADMAVNNCVVIQSLIKFGPGAVPGDTFKFQLHDQGAETIVYSEPTTPLITITEMTAGSGM